MNKDDFKWDYTKEIRKPLKNGTILLSEPFMEDDVFKRSVCIVCDHNTQEGTFGFLINRNMNKKVHELVDGLAGIEADVYYGGPVGNDSLYYIHTNEPELEGAKHIAGDMYWGGDYEQLQTYLKEGLVDFKKIKFIVGYSGWDPNQLRKEIIENSWIVNNDISSELVFSNSKLLWNDIMQNMGGIYKTMSGYPEHPTLN